MKNFVLRELLVGITKLPDNYDFSDDFNRFQANFFVLHLPCWIDWLDVFTSFDCMLCENINRFAISLNII